MSSNRRRERIRRRRGQNKRRTYLLWGAIGTVVLLIVGYFLWVNLRPQAGEAIPVMPSRDHVPEGTDPGPYNSDPPSSGEHYASPLPAGFYTPGQAESLGEYPEGYLVHSLEHGYVIFWYNCDAPGVSDCDGILAGVRQVMNDYDNVKLIAFPWSSIDVPVAMTSWGHRLLMEEFDPDAAAGFIDRNRFRAPEPNAP